MESVVKRLEASIKRVEAEVTKKSGGCGEKKRRTRLSRIGSKWVELSKGWRRRWQNSQKTSIDWLQVAWEAIQSIGGAVLSGIFAWISQRNYQPVPKNVQKHQAGLAAQKQAARGLAAHNTRVRRIS